MNESKQYCTFCGSFTFKYLRSVKKKGKFLCFDCADSAYKIKKKILLAENQLNLNITIEFK